MHKVAYIILYAILMGCGNESTTYNRNYDSFFSLNRSSRDPAFARYPIADQYRIMQIGNSEFEPPMLELIDEFAQNGSRVIPMIKSDLRSKPDGIHVRNIAEVALSVQRKGLYRSADDAELMRLLRLAAASDTSIWRKSTEGILKEIEQRS